MIDISELHIGSHVLFNGERVEVDSIFSHDEYGYHKDEVMISGSNDFPPSLCVSADQLDPIPITYELLKDIMTENGEIEQVGNIISSETTHGQHKISIVITGEVIGVMVNRLDDCYSFVAQCMNIKFLHELEAFIYLTTKQRLI